MATPKQRELTLNTKQPNWTNKAVQKRTAHVLAWCKAWLSADRPRQFHSSKITDVFGHAKGDLSKYLRSNLLIQSGAYKVGTSSYSYRLNAAGFKKISGYVTIGLVVPVDQAHAEELATLDFKYRIKSDRFWHPLQNMRREAKQEFWQAAGLPNNYDIDACAPTILLGLANKFGLNQMVAEPIAKYLADKNGLRTRLAALLDLSYDDSKRLINSLFNGAVLSASPFCTAYRTLGNSRTKMKLLQEDVEVRLLRNAIKAMWGHIQRRTKEDLSKGKGKWSLYFRWERKVLEVIKVHLDERSIRYFTEHDGFRTDREVDLDQLMAQIEAVIGFRLTVTKTESMNS